MDMSTAFGTIARLSAAMVAGALIKHGLTVSDAQTTAIAGGLVAAMTLAWSWWQKVGQAKLIEVAAKAGPLVPQGASTEAAVKAAQRASAVTGFCVAIFAFSLLFPSDAYAAQKLRTDSTEQVITAGSQKGVQTLGGIIANVKQFTVDDLTAAAADADNQPCATDPAKKCPDPAGDCWRILIPAVQAQQSPLPAGLGLAQAIQKARDIQRQVNTGVPDQIKTKCAIVLWDAEAGLLRLGINLAPLPKLPGLPF